MSSTMEGPLSAYWVRFFKAAGFNSDVATRHAVVFSNNRIQPDMLPDLDKPSLKEMGITLMGDMIAILRYAKKVVEETTCERFLVDSNDVVSSKAKPQSQTPAKKVAPKVASKAVTTKSQIQTSAKKVTTKTLTVKKKTIPTRTIIQSTEKTKPQIIKRKLAMDTEENDSEDEDYESSKRSKMAADDSVGYKIIMPKGTTARSQTILKKAAEQKRTVFDRLGDSSVTSTTSSNEGNPIFNITGFGKSVVKRMGNNVFNRLGDKDLKKENQSYSGILQNGTAPQGILKNSRSSIVSTTKVVKKPIGTMRADFERKKKIIAIPKNVKQSPTSNKLASERLKQVSAKQRLGTSKQVTFNKFTTVTHVKKSDVFSRLGL